MRVGVVGAGTMGSAIVELLARDGNDVIVASRSPERALTLASGRRRVHAGGVDEALAFGSAAIVAIPDNAWPDFAAAHDDRLAETVVVDISVRWSEKNAPAPPRCARALNVLAAETLLEHATLVGRRIGIPFAADGPSTIETAARLLRTLGFAPVLVGGLAEAWRFGPQSEVYGRPLCVDDLIEILGPCRAWA